MPDYSSRNMIFDDKIEFETIELEVASDVVIYSFIVQKSLTYLDLSVCEISQRRKCVSTEEECRKVLEPRREILYTYHLDLPINLENSLRSVIPTVDDKEHYECFHLGVMFVCEFLYTRNLARHVVLPIISARHNIEKLRRYFNVMKFLNFHKCRRTAMLLFDHLILALFPHSTDSNLVVEFALTFRFYSWIFHNDVPVIVGYILHHAMRIGCNILQESESGLDPINGCIVYRSPRNISVLLQYGTVLSFRKDAYLGVLGRPLARRLIRRISRKHIPDRRAFLLLQLFYYFKFINQYFDGLLCIWRSIPDPHLSESEIRFLFENVISPEELHYMTEFYKLKIVEEAAEIEDEAPRPLQHLCRVVVRGAMIRNRQVPFGIDQLGMPRLIRNYLNLEC